MCMYSRCRHRYTFIYFYRQVLVALIVACVLLRFAEKARSGCDSMGGVARAIQGPNRVVKHTCFFFFWKTSFNSGVGFGWGRLPPWVEWKTLAFFKRKTPPPCFFWRTWTWKMGTQLQRCFFFSCFFNWHMARPCPTDCRVTHSFHHGTLGARHEAAQDANWYALLASNAAETVLWVTLSNGQTFSSRQFLGWRILTHSFSDFG